MKIIFNNNYRKIENERQIFFDNLSRGFVLDVGCAQLTNPYLKNNKNKTKSFGVDLQKPASNDYDEFIQLDLNNNILPFEDNFFDTIIAGEFLEHIENPFKVLRNFHKILKNNGIFALSMPNAYYFGEIIRRIIGAKASEDNEHLYLHDNISISNMLKKTGFKIEKIYGYKMWIPGLKWHLISFSLPKLFSYQIIYVCKKK